MQKESSHPQAHVTGYVFCCLLVALILLSLATAAGACRVGSSSHPGKTPAPAPVPRSTTAPKPAPSVKVCPASSRYNPKTARCERIRF